MKRFQEDILPIKAGTNLQWANTRARLGKVIDVQPDTVILEGDQSKSHFPVRTDVLVRCVKRGNLKVVK